MGEEEEEEDLSNLVAEEEEEAVEAVSDPQEIARFNNYMDAIYRRMNAALRAKLMDPMVLNMNAKVIKNEVEDKKSKRNKREALEEDVDEDEEEMEKEMEEEEEEEEVEVDRMGLTERQGKKNKEKRGGKKKDKKSKKGKKGKKNKTANVEDKEDKKNMSPEKVAKRAERKAARLVKKQAAKAAKAAKKEEEMSRQKRSKKNGKKGKVNGAKHNEHKGKGKGKKGTDKESRALNKKGGRGGNGKKGKKGKVNGAKHNGNKGKAGKGKGKGKGNNKSKARENKQADAKSMGSLAGIATLRREGDVEVQDESSHKTVTSSFTVGPLQLEVSKTYGHGKERTVRTAKASTDVMTGTMILKVKPDGSAHVKKVVFQKPEQVDVLGSISDQKKRSDSYLKNSVSKMRPIAAQKILKTARYVLKAPSTKQ